MDSRRHLLELRTINAVLTGTTWLVADRYGAFLQAGRVFAIERDGRKLAPAYAFNADGEPYAALAAVLSILNGYAPFRLAAWFESTSSTLSGRRPRELLASDPQAVIAAARSHAVGPQHG